MLSSSTKHSPILLTVCLLTVFPFAPARAQETQGEILSISRTGHSPAIDAGSRGGFVLAWTNIDHSDQEMNEEDPEETGLFLWRYELP